MPFILRNSQKSKRKRTAQQGYGLALLVIFLASLIIIASSIQMMSGATASMYLGSASKSHFAAKDVATVALDAAEDDVLSKLNAGQTIDTTYCYPASTPCGSVTNTVSMPDNPASPGTLNNTVGSYYVYVSKGRDNWYVLNAVANINGSTVNFSRLFGMRHNSFALDGIVNPTAAYGLRRLRAGYTGAAIKVRRASDNAVQDIGFTPNGDLDVRSLNTFLATSTLPLDTVTGASAAYSLRKLRTAYTGTAIQVRRSSDNTLSNIGFDSKGNLDIVSLLKFVGTGSGYVKTWYDQSGNGRNVSQATNSKQPRIVNSGVVDTQNNRPVVMFIDTSLNTLTTTSAPLAAGDDDYTFLTVFETNTMDTDRVIMEQDTAAAGAAGQRAAISLHGYVQNNNRTGGFTGEWNDTYYSFPYTTGVMYQLTMTINNALANNVTFFQNGQAGTAIPLDAGSRTALNLSAGGFALGSKYADSGSEYLNGGISEAIVYNSVLSTANHQTIERDENQYYAVRGPMPGYVTTWYDQSGNGYNLTQTNTLRQPTVILEPLTGRYSVSFDGVYTYLDKTGITFASTQASALAVAKSDTPIPTPTYSPSYDLADWGTLFAGWQNGMTNEYDNVASADFLQLDFGTPGILWYRNNNEMSGDISFGTPFQASTIFNGSKGSIYVNGTKFGSATSSGSFLINNLRVGSSTAILNTDFWLGTISEVILYPIGFTDGQRQVIENDQRAYWAIP